MGFLLSLMFGYIPAFFNAGIIYSLDRYEKEPKRLLIGVFLWGALVAAGAAYVINSLLGEGVYLFTASTTATDLTICVSANNGCKNAACTGTRGRPETQ